MEDNLYSFLKRTKTSIFMKMEDDLKKIMQSNAIESKNNGCGTSPDNLVLSIFHVNFIFAVAADTLLKRQPA
jgi:hypothetical protein